MKIWKAELILFYTFEKEELQTEFIFELEEHNYKENEKFNEWIYFEDWVSDRIPVNMTIERFYDNYKIVQGFDYELNKEELEQLEKDMRECMKKQLEYDKELYLKKYEEKLKVIQGVDWYEKIAIISYLLLVLILTGCTYDNKSGYTKCILVDHSGTKTEYNIKDYIRGSGGNLRLILDDNSAMDVYGDYRFEK